MAVDERSVIEAVSGLGLRGNEEGLIPAFGLYLTRHFSDYYNAASFAYLHAAEKKGPAAVAAARAGLIEAGHVCAFNTFGGIMLSQEWEAVVLPMLESREDWAHGIVAVINALGWGMWKIESLTPGEELQVSLRNSYESEGYLANHTTRNEGGVCFLGTGGVAGVMNLLYHGDIIDRPALTPDFYTKLFGAPERFVAEETECRAHGADACRIVARRAGSAGA